MYCKYCGTELSDDATFCASCGKNFLEETTTPPVQVQVVQPVKEQRPFNKANIVSFVLPFLLAPISIFWLLATMTTGTNMNSNNTGSIVAFFVSFGAGLLLLIILPIVSLIVGIKAVKKCNKENLRGKGLGITGIVLSSIIIIYGILVAAIIGLSLISSVQYVNRANEAVETAITIEDNTNDDSIVHTI